MRPPKRILIVERNQFELSLRRLVFEVHAFRVVGTTDAAEALQIIADNPVGHFDVLVTNLEVRGTTGNALVRKAKQLHPGLPSLIYSPTSSVSSEAICADVFLPKGACNAAEIINRTKTLAARKRGPKKVDRTYSEHMEQKRQAAKIREQMKVAA